MKLSTILIIMLTIDLFCFYGIQTHDAIMSYPSWDPTLEVNTFQQIGNRPAAIFMELNSTTGEVGTEANQTMLSTFTEWTSSIGMAILSATGQWNIARDILGAISLLFQILMSPFIIAEVLGTSTVWFVGHIISLVYTVLICVAGLAAIRGGEV
jgi:hypothetical protein